MTITAAILCGGQGTRLQPVIGPDLPKCLAPVAERPFIEYVLDYLAGQGVKVAIICGGPNNHTIANAIEPKFDHTWKGMEIGYSIERTPLGTGGALRNALPLLDSDPVLVLNGDTFCKFDTSDLVRTMDVYEAEAAPTTVDGAVLLFGWDSFSGVRLLRESAIEAMPDGPFDLDEWVIKRKMENHVIQLVRRIPFHDIGTPEGYATAEGFLREQGVIK